VSWATVLAVAALCIALRVGAPLLLAGRGLPQPVERVLGAAIVPLLAALVAFQLFRVGGHFGVDARAGGVAAAAGVFLVRRSFLLALATAAVVTALLRLA
jgi:branched-subunit amino acid transport protein